MHTCSLLVLSPFPGFNHLFSRQCCHFKAVCSCSYACSISSSILIVLIATLAFAFRIFSRPIFHHRQIRSPPLVDLLQILPCLLKGLVAIPPPNTGVHLPPPLTSPMACTLSQEVVCPKTQVWATPEVQRRASRCQDTQMRLHPIRPCLTIPTTPHPTRPCLRMEEVTEEARRPFQLSM